MKISFLGAGQVGGQGAYLAAAEGLADICLYDIREGLAKGKALDIGQALAFPKTDIAVVGGSEIRDTSESDVLVVTAGISRRPGMTREDLLFGNANTVRALLLEALEWSPDAIVIMVTNPINTMTYLAATACGVAKSRVIGMAGLLDNARFAYFIAQELNCGFQAIESWVIGDHGDRVVPVVSHTTVHGRQLSERLTPEQLADVYGKTRSAGTQIVNYLQQGSASIAPGSAILRMLRSIADKDNAPVPCSVYLEGEYGQTDIVVGVPARIGGRGVKEVIELTLSEQEAADFGLAVKGIREVNQTLLALLMSELAKDIM